MSPRWGAVVEHLGFLLWMEGVVCDRALFGGRPGQRVPLSGQVGLLQEVCAREILEESLPREWSVAERYTRRG